MGIKTNDSTIGFFGLGLIGGSIARAIRSRHPETHIMAYTRRKNPALEEGMREGVIDTLVYEVNESFAACDILFLCAPVLTNIGVLRTLKPLIGENCIVTDVGSVKGTIQKEAIRLGMEKNFIGGHPMAGSEKTGYANSTAELLKDSYYLLSPTAQTSEEHLNRLLSLLACTQSKCVVIDPDTHDDVTAAISHIPHIAAAALVNLVQNNDDENSYMKTFAAGGFRDITRIASSSPEMWESICLSNKDSICCFLEKYIASLRSIQNDIQSENKEALHAFFQEAGDYRNSLR